jgi:hypothetical protein
LKQGETAVVRSTLILAAAMLASAPASAVTLMDSAPPPTERGQPVPVPASNGRPLGHLIIGDFENTLGDTASSARIKNSFATLPPVPAAAAVRADAPNVTAVPEPASWAMMIAGFALIGGTMRRRAPIVLGRQ